MSASFVTPWIVQPTQAPLSLALLRQKYWSGMQFPSPGILPNPGIEPTSLASPALAGGFFTAEPPGKPFMKYVSGNKSFFETRLVPLLDSVHRVDHNT